MRETGRQTLIRTAAALAFVLTAGMLQARDILDTLDVLAFSHDGVYVAYTTYGDVSAVGDASPPGWILIRDTVTGEIVDKTKISEFLTDLASMEGNPELKEKVVKNKKMKIML